MDNPAPRDGPAPERLPPAPEGPTDPGCVYLYEFAVPESAIDVNGHVNNVVYVQWMQDVAIRHAAACGGTAAAQALGCTWVARSHRIEYLSPARVGEIIQARTWVHDFRRVRSLRKYGFFRKSDQRLLAQGETEWVFVTLGSFRPRSIPPEVSSCFKLPGPAG